MQGVARSCKKFKEFKEFKEFKTIAGSSRSCKEFKTMARSSRSSCAKFPAKEVVFSDFMFNFALSLTSLLVFYWTALRQAPPPTWRASIGNRLLLRNLTSIVNPVVLQNFF